MRITKDLSTKDLLQSVRRVSSRNIKDRQKNWKKYVVGFSLFVVLLARVVFLHVERHRLWQRLVDRYETDAKKDGRLRPSEVAQFLRDSGINITRDQFLQWVGGIDDEKDGFDEAELMTTIEVFDDFDSASGSLVQLGYQPFGMSAFGDSLLVVLFAAGLVYVLSSSEALERRFAAHSFVSAVRMSKMQRKWQVLEKQIAVFDEERSRLEGCTQGLTDASEEAARRAAEYEAKLQDEKAKASTTEERLRQVNEELERHAAEAQAAQEALKRHNEELKKLKGRENTAQSELSRLRTETEKHMEEAHMSTAKLRAMSSCLRGINAFGAQSPFKGAGEGKYCDQGATTGFAVQNRDSLQQVTSGGANRHMGFRMESFVFGYPTGDSVEMYEVDRKRDLLGEGADCAYKCRNIATREQLALKIYEITAGGHRRQILSDLHAHQATQDHPHIVKYKAVIETQEQIFVLMELIKGKDLFSDIIDRQGLLERRAATILAQICDALKFLHENDIIHGDIKPENIMLEKPETDEPHVKVIDFGFSCFLNKDAQDHEGHVANMRQLVADIYAPPEALEINPRVTKDIDMFRLGCCLYVMLMATYPFDRSRAGRDLEDRKKGNVLKYPRWKTLSADAQDLITTLVRDRIGVDQVMAHPWMVTNWQPRT